jgi:hypothetical protein
MICIPHESDHEMCVRALHAIERYGGHLFTHAEWGCKAGVHCGWVVVELDNRDAAVQMVPPEFRAEAQIVELNRFTKDEVYAWIAKLDDSPKSAPPDNS